MTEHEKLLASLEYDMTDPELQQIMCRTKSFLDEFNAAAYSDLEKRAVLLGKMLKECGHNVSIRQPFFILYGVHTQIGHDVFINYNCNFLDGNTISIGNRVMIGPDVKLYAANHSLNARERFRQMPDGSYRVISHTFPITIGDDVWIGGNSTILPGVTVGSNVVVAGGSVVTKDVADNCLVGGNPARIIRELPPL